MIDVHLLALAARQHRCVAVWQLSRLGCSVKAIEHRVRAGWLIRLYDGVYVVGPVGDDPPTRWRASTLTPPETGLAIAGAAGADGFWNGEAVVVVVGPGNGGPEQVTGLRICRSACL